MHASQLLRSAQVYHPSDIYVPSWVRVLVASIKIPFFNYPNRENSCTWMHVFSGAVMETSCARVNVNLTGVQYSSDGDNGNRATASEMSLPTLLKFKRRQRVVRYMLQLIVDRVLREAQRVGKIGPRVNIAYEITFPEIDSGEHNTLAQGMQWLLPALRIAKSEGWVSDETAMKIMFEYCGEEVDVHEERARIADQRRDRALRP